MKITTLTIAVTLSAGVCLADANVQQKTQFHMAGAVGSIINAVSRSAREGVTSQTVIKGNRKLTRTGDGGEIIDLAEEKVYTIDFGRKTYSVKTFADIRREFEEQQAKAKREAEKDSKAQKSEGPEYEVDFDVKSTGNKQAINGWDTHEEIVTISVHEKGKKIEKSGGWVMTSDMWMGPKIPAMKEILEFDRKYAQKIYGSTLFDAHNLAMLLATTPAFGKAMKTLNDKSASFDGTPIMTKLTFETVAGTDAPKQEAKADDSSSTPTSISGAVMGGLMNRMKKRQEEKKAESGQAANRSTLFDSSSELLKAASVATSDEVTIPAGFKQR